MLRCGDAAERSQSGATAVNVAEKKQANDMSPADIGKIVAALEKIFGELEGLKEIPRSIVSMESILSGQVTRMNEVESCVESLEAVDGITLPLARERSTCSGKK